MDAYGPGFAKAYDARWSSFATGIAALIHAYYETACLNGRNLSSISAAAQGN
jgi:hypothetical protein